MPFKSKSQMKKCFALQGRGQGKGWDCEEWAHATPSIKKLPEKKGAAQARVVTQLEKRAKTMSELLGIRAGALLLGVPVSSR